MSVQIYNKDLDWKIERDTFYFPLYKQYGFDYIVDAGFFYDDSTENADIKDSMKMICTPLRNISRPKTNKHCVIVTTGSMCPIHDGHIEMVVKAKERLEKAGYEVIGGYICPDHDSYVSRKTGDSHISIADRNILISEKIWEHNLQSWLALDPWYGTFNTCDLNFTDLITRTKLYLKEHFEYENFDTEIVYVCGGDVANFSKTFVNEGLCVIVTRPGYTKVNSITETDRVFIAECSNNSSSSQIRKESKFTRPELSSLKLRNDNTSILPFIDKYFKHIEHISLQDQLDKFNELDSSSIISLDPLINKEYYLGVSREYDVFGHTKLGYNIKGYTDQLDELFLPGLDKSKAYTLYDDDIYTGNTMRFTADFLKSKDIIIDKYLSFNITKESDIEVLDNRDFILFGKHSGLVINFKGFKMRAPYIYPFVDPRMRCSILDPIQFSIDVWKHNMELLEGSNKTLKELHRTERILYIFIGFHEETKLYDICEYYYNKLIK